jgi:hypothetical protein
MDYKITLLEYNVLEGGKIVHSGTTPSFLLNTLTDMYCDFKNSPYKLEIKYKDKTFIVGSPADFEYPR